MREYIQRDLDPKLGCIFVDQAKVDAGKKFWRSPSRALRR
jgi:hypothetical protein